MTNQRDVVYEYFHPGSASQEDVTSLIKCYQTVFSEPPWSEWKKCSVCEKYWGIDSKSIVEKLNYTHCGSKLVDFWSYDQGSQDIVEETGKEGSVCLVARNNHEIIGFCWGYPIETKHLENKLGLSLNLPKDLNKVVYLDDMGVLSNYRGQKVASSLFNLRMARLKELDIKYQIARVRKSPEPSVTFLWYKNKLGFKVIAKYSNDDGRVVIGKEL